MRTIDDAAVGTPPEQAEPANASPTLTRRQQSAKRAPNYATKRRQQRYEVTANNKHGANDYLPQRANRAHNHDRTTFQPHIAPKRFTRDMT